MSSDCPTVDDRMHVPRAAAGDGGYGRRSSRMSTRSAARTRCSRDQGVAVAPTLRAAPQARPAPPPWVRAVVCLVRSGAAVVVGEQVAAILVADRGLVIDWPSDSSDRTK